MPVGCPYEVAEGMWLARATTYVREWMNTCSAVVDKCSHRVQKIPPDRMMEPVNLQHSMNVIKRDRRGEHRLMLTWCLGQQSSAEGWFTTEQ